ncbi:MAG: 5-(carboxyamino)imidazole ribonucleotide mutase [Synergistaceae bacterium]|jgi:5-(carboxyamino)imidazole ribonucleotide mutase|nr:5-(carboxyamino)imidazole ribonucleotide mutase [Synergistaceae bacterium]
MANNKKKPIIGILTGSQSDVGIVTKAVEVLKEFGVRYEVGIASAHRTPDDVANYAAGAGKRGVAVIIAMAGLSAALPGAVAAHTTLPVVGVPIASGALSGFDALLSAAQMPPGMPVACMSVDGGKNAALFALRILALSDKDLAERLEAWSKKSADQTRKSREKLEDMHQIPPEAFIKK